MGLLSLHGLNLLKTMVLINILKHFSDKSIYWLVLVAQRSQG